jgi:hypothetical protein
MARNHSKDLEPEEFKCFTGVYHPTFEKMLAVLYKHESHKKKSMRPPELSLQDQLLVALQHWRAYRSHFHHKRSPGEQSYAAGRMTCYRSSGVSSKDGTLFPQSVASQAAVR